MAKNRGSGKLEITLPSDLEILMTRTLDAPRRLVFEAMIRPEHVRRWWCCMDGFTMTVCDMDVRVGGRWRYVIVGPPGEVAFNGVYQEVAPPERLVHSEFLEPHPDGLIVTITLEERDGKTYYRSLSLAVSKEQRDAVLASGMEVGADLALDRMLEVALSLAPGGGEAQALPG
jgi:uncharacterized protein YndB with AHSA1/START domain